MMENINKSVKVLIKTPNQKIGDQLLECLLDWTVNRLKLHISEMYPGKPTVEDQKLIYSGRLLHDHLKLKDILRHDDGETHILHLVCAGKDSTSTTINNIEDCVQRIPSQNSVMNSEGVRHRAVSQQANQNFSTTLPMPTIPVSAEQVAQQMMAMQQMYAYYMTQYLQQTQTVATPASLQASTASQSPIANNVANQNIGAPARPVNENVRMNAQGGPLIDDEDEEFRNRDWLDWFYTISRGLVLFSIVYFYSSPGRFMIVIGIALFAYLYQGGFLGARQQQNEEENPREQRQNDERINNNEAQLPNRSTTIPPEQQPNQQEGQDDARHSDNAEDEREQTEQIQDEDNRSFPIYTTAWTFVSSFFSSLIPEQPAPVDIN